jgi:amidase
VVAAAELAWLDGVAQAELVRAGQASALELIEAAIERVEALNPSLNFLVESLADGARARASEARGDSRLAGVPMMLKDHLATCAGVPHTSGSRFLRDYVAPADSELVRRYKRAGLIAVGTSATCELALLSTASSARYGPCRNPWALDRTTGGSSGGSAAAVAAGCVPIAHGNDAGGSIRIPASCCGLFGLKPTRARNPLGPAYGDMYSGLWAEHVLTRSVRDSAATLDLTAGAMAGDPYAAPPASGAYLDQVGAPAGPLRIAVSSDAPTGVQVHGDCREAAQHAAKLCETLGHAVEEAAPPVDGASLEQAFFVVYAAGAAWCVEAWTRTLGRSPAPDELEPATWGLVELGRRKSAAEYLLAVQHLQAAARRIDRFHETFDVWLSPTLAAPPVRMGYFEAPVEDPLHTFELDSAFAAFTWIANATGQPAMSVPLHWNDENLPIGAHFTAACGREDLLIRLASQLEQARPWAQRRPPSST